MVCSNGSVFLLNRVMNERTQFEDLKSWKQPFEKEFVPIVNSKTIHLPVEVENTDVFSRVP